VEAGGVERGHVRCRKLEDVPVDAARRGNVFDRQVLGERLRVELARNAAVGREGLQLAGEDAARCPAGGLGEKCRAARECVIERLLPEPVAGEDELLAARVPERDGKHPLQLFDEFLAPFEIRAEHHFGIAAGREGVAVLAQPLADLAVLVRLSVEDQRHAAGRHRLYAAFDVEDREPAMPERRRSVEEESVRVGTAVGERRGHPADRFPVWRPREVDVSADAAHRC